MDLAASRTTHTAVWSKIICSNCRENPTMRALSTCLSGYNIPIRGEDPSHKQQPDDLFNLTAYDLAEECLLSTYVALSGVQNVISRGHLPVYKPGHFRHRDLRSNWFQKTPREKIKDDEQVLLEAFPALMGMKILTSRSSLAENDLIRDFRDMEPGKDF